MRFNDANMKVSSTGNTGCVLVMDGVGRGRNSLVFSFTREGSAATNLSRVIVGDIV